MTGLAAYIEVEGTEDFSEQAIANMINSALVEPLESLLSLEEERTPLADSIRVYILSALEKLNTRRAAGPDEIPTWLLKG